MDDHGITIEKATPDNADVAAKLTLMALGNSAKVMFGVVDDAIALDYLGKLWPMKRNRFSHMYAYIAKIGDKPVGLMSCFPGEMTTKNIYPTVLQLIRIGKFTFVRHMLSQVRMLRQITSHVEAYPDEFYIGTLAVLAEYQSMGIGALFLEFMGKQAKAAGLCKCALLVDKDNIGGIRFYERHGFKIDGYWEKPVPFYRMVVGLGDDK